MIQYLYWIFPALLRELLGYQLREGVFELNWFRNFMYGRYGMDQLSLAMVVLAMIFSLIRSIFGVPLIWILSWVLLILVYFRVFSRNFSKRYAENQKFLRIFSPISAGIKQGWRRFRDRKTYKYFKCPGCGAHLRVPKNKGKLLVTCPKCGAKTEIKS